MLDATATIDIGMFVHCYYMCTNWKVGRKNGAPNGSTENPRSVVEGADAEPIPDGNRSWAKERGLETVLGHSEGKCVLEKLIVVSEKWGIKVLSLYCFSSKNWKRPKEVLPEGLKAELMPKHVAVILDGNRRWAKEEGLPVSLGLEGKSVMMQLVFLSSKWGIKVLSLFCFSTENWTYVKEDVDFLMSMLEEVMTEEYDSIRYSIRVSLIGDKSKFPESVIAALNTIEEKTKHNEGIHVMVGINYSGRYDILQATRSITGKVKDGILSVEDINESLIHDELETRCAKYPVPDLLIRTSGEQRISNFMLWQLAYTELFFSKKNFPEFEEQDYVEALLSFQKRDRRYGGKKY